MVTGTYKKENEASIRQFLCADSTDVPSICIAWGCICGCKCLWSVGRLHDNSGLLILQANSCSKSAELVFFARARELDCVASNTRFFLILALTWLWKQNGWTVDFGSPLKTSPAIVVLREDFESIETLYNSSRAWFVNSKQAFLMHPQCNRIPFRSILATSFEIRLPFFIYRSQKEHVIGCS